MPLHDSERGRKICSYKAIGLNLLESMSDYHQIFRFVYCAYGCFTPSILDNHNKFTSRLICFFLKREPLIVPEEPSTEEEQDEMRPEDETKPEEDDDLIEPVWRPKLRKKRKRKTQGW